MQESNRMVDFVMSSAYRLVKCRGVSLISVGQLTSWNWPLIM